MTRLVIDLGTIELSDRAQDVLLAELHRTALLHLAKVRFDEAFAIPFPKILWNLMLHGASRGHWPTTDNAGRHQGGDGRPAA